MIKIRTPLGVVPVGVRTRTLVPLWMGSESAEDVTSGGVVREIGADDFLVAASAGLCECHRVGIGKRKRRKEKRLNGVSVSE
jgi:hypothetical protein